ncbi:MAG: hypothetical protein IJ225_02360 [Solobacterium sp.]|nr:hypothetical protein [Solobacterium sp.]
MKFSVEQNVKDLGVDVVGVVITGIDNTSKSEEYKAWRESTVASLLERYRDYDVKQDAVLEGFYSLHAKVGVPRRKNPSAPENLIRLLEKKQGLFEINKAVDIYNLVSLDTRLALGAHDIDRLDGNVTLRLTDGTERFVPLGSPEPKPVKAGEYSYIDDSNEIVCHLEIRQVEKDKVTEDTTNVFYIVQGNEAVEHQVLLDAAKQLIDLTVRFCGGSGEILES